MNWTEDEINDEVNFPAKPSPARIETQAQQDDRDFDPQPDIQEIDELQTHTKKKHRIITSETLNLDDDDMPLKYKHLRTSVRNVKPSFYRKVDKIISTLHCPKHKPLEVSLKQVMVCLVKTGSFTLKKMS